MPPVGKGPAYAPSRGAAGPSTQPAAAAGSAAPLARGKTAEQLSSLEATMQQAHTKLTEVAKQPATQPGGAKAPGQGASSSSNPNLKRASSAGPKPNPAKPPEKARPSTADAAAPTRTSAEFTLIEEVSRAHQALAWPQRLPSAALARRPLPLVCTPDLFLSLKRFTASTLIAFLRACLPSPRFAKQEKIVEMVLNQDRNVAAAVAKRQQQHFVDKGKVLSVWADERSKSRAIRQTNVMRKAAPPARKTEPFTSPLPVAAGHAEAPAASSRAPSAAPPKGGKGAGMPGARRGSSSKAIAPAFSKKQSSKMVSLQHNRPGDKPKGLKGWIRDLDARGWSKKKTAMVRGRAASAAPLPQYGALLTSPCLACAQSAGLEAWFEAYAEAYTAIRLAKQIKPFVVRRSLQELRDAAHWWWIYAKALASKGGISAGIAGRIAFLEHATMMLRWWRTRAQFYKGLPQRMVSMGYGRLLRDTLAEWRANIEGPRARRAELRALMQQGFDHYRLRLGLPNAWLIWCVRRPCFAPRFCCPTLCSPLLIDHRSRLPAGSNCAWRARSRTSSPPSSGVSSRQGCCDFGVRPPSLVTRRSSR